MTPQKLVPSKTNNINMIKGLTSENLSYPPQYETITVGGRRQAEGGTEPSNASPTIDSTTGSKF